MDFCKVFGLFANIISMLPFNIRESELGILRYLLNKISKVAAVSMGIVHRLYHEMRTLRNFFTLPYTGTATQTRFVVLAQSRSGTHLILDLLNSHPDIQCDKDVFKYHLPKLLSYQRYFHNRSRNSGALCYGFVMHPTRIPKLNDIESDTFLYRLHNAGWKLIYLKRRNILRQAVSWEIAKSSQVWHVSKSERTQAKHHINCQDLIRRIRLREIDLEREKLYLQGVPFIELVYERDLLHRDQHQTTLNRLFAHLGLPPHPVDNNLSRTGSDLLQDLIENYSEVEQVVIAAGYGHCLS